MTKVEEINKFMLTTLLENGFEDTPVNRADFLEGLCEAWSEMSDEIEDAERLDYVLYRIAAIGELSVQRLRARLVLS